MQPAEKWTIGEPRFNCDSMCEHHRVWPWNGHRLFGYDLVRFLRPERIVELGTYWGTSFFTFCQAVKDENIGSEIIAVDTWEGDEHTGEYGKDPYENVKATVAEHYGELQTTLLRMYFKQALERVENDSVDLLHIDGCHTYEAAKEDFESWLPKLRPEGVVLLHDIADSCDYGSRDYYKELQQDYPSLTFQHSWGLGVVFPKGERVYSQMVADNIFDKIRIYEHLSEFNLMRILKESHEDRGERQHALIQHQEQVISELNHRCEELEQQLSHAQLPLFAKIIKKLRTLS